MDLGEKLLPKYIAETMLRVTNHSQKPRLTTITLLMSVSTVKNTVNLQFLRNPNALLTGIATAKPEQSAYRGGLGGI